MTLVKHRITKSEAVKQRSPLEGVRYVRHPFIGGDKGDGSDVSGKIKTTLRALLSRDARTWPTLRRAAYLRGDYP